MPSDAEILVTCTNGSCPLRNHVPLMDLATFRLLSPEGTIPSYDEAQATTPVIACPSCARAGREGTLVYLADHLRKAPPDVTTPVPTVFDGLSSLWKRALELSSVPGQTAKYKPETLSIPRAVRLELRPYGGHMLRPGNSDEIPQYGTLAAGQPALPTKPRYIRELKHDLLYLAYFGSRERNRSKEFGGVSVFETTTVGAILGLKFDLWFFYGVPTTTDIAQATVSEAEFRGLTLDTFSKPIYFDPKMLDNPVKPIAVGMIYPLAAAMMDLYLAHEEIGEALDLIKQSGAPDLSPKKARDLRGKALKHFAVATRDLPKEAAPLAMGDLKKVKGERKQRALEEVLAHPHFTASKTKAWPYFERCLRAIAAIHGLRISSHIHALELLADGGDKKFAKPAKRALDRYKPYIEGLSGLEQADVDELQRIIGGLPETFEPYRAQLHDFAVVDHSTALYIKSILAGVKIGSNSGKVVKQPGRKLAYRMPEEGIKDEPETLDAYADLVIKACEDGKSFNVPPLIMLERQKNESGFRATDAVRECALTVDERKVFVPMVGVDFHNWGLKDNKARSNFCFSELFTNSVSVTQKYPGYLGPIILSRGVGGGQVTVATMLEGVTEPGRAQVSDKIEWVAGIPVPEKGVMPAPGSWAGSKKSIERARNLLQSKFEDDSRGRNCTFDKVPGGKKFDCASCLARFDLAKASNLVWNRAGGSASYHCNVEASRWKALFGEDLARDDEAGRTEYPCSWLRAVQRYAGTGPSSFDRILKTAREIVEVGTPLPKSDDKKSEAGEDPAEGEETPEEEEEEAAPKKGTKGKKGKKGKKLTPPQLAIRAAFERVRGRL